MSYLPSNSGNGIPHAASGNNGHDWSCSTWGKQREPGRRLQFWTGPVRGIEDLSCQYAIALPLEPCKIVRRAKSKVEDFNGHWLSRSSFGKRKK